MFPVYKSIAEIFCIIFKLIKFTVSFANITSWKLETAEEYLPFVPLHHACRLFFGCLDAGIIYFLFLEDNNVEVFVLEKNSAYKELHEAC